MTSLVTVHFVAPRPPMPFGCVAFGALAPFINKTLGVKLSPMPFGSVAFEALYHHHEKLHHLPPVSNAFRLCGL